MEFLKQYLDFMVFGILGLMSFLMVWFVIERFIFYARFKVDQCSNADQLQVTLTHRLTAISTIGSNAPYIGLLGTVFGILITFWDIGQGGGNIDPAAIMLGLALALKATAAGLVVAIPSILFYNTLLRKVDVISAEWKQAHPQ
jgi:biopolymer transport protein ExbB